MLENLSNWLASSHLNTLISDNSWVIPGVQTVHILAISVVMGSMLMLDLRLLGVRAQNQTIPQVAERFLPWTWGAVVTLLCSGIILIIGEPARELLNSIFWLKMSLLFCALALTGVFQYVLGRRPGFWERSRTAALLTGIVSLTLWVCIITAGRWIAYVEHG